MSCESLLGVKSASSLFHVYLYVNIFVILPGKVHHEKQVLGLLGIRLYTPSTISVWSEFILSNIWYLLEWVE